MDQFDIISTEVNNIIFKYLISNGNIIVDEGEGNVLMLNSSPCRWNYINSTEIHEGRTIIEDNKIRLLNDTMNVLVKFQNLMAIRAEAPIETIDPYTSIHTKLDLSKSDNKSEDSNNINKLSNDIENMLLD